MAGNARNIRATRTNKWHITTKVKSPARLSYKEKCRIIYFKRQKHDKIPIGY